jgi:hypothetical protein
MLRVSIHAGGYADVSQANLTDWLDIASEQREAVSPYKVVLFCTGTGAKDPCTLEAYPRWSASLWDLVARAIAASLMGSDVAADGTLPDVLRGKHVAFAERLCAVIRHVPCSGIGVRELGHMELRRFRRGRGVYTATLHEELQPSRSILPFVFAPAFLRPAELVMRAALVALTGDHVRLPAKPALVLPRPISIGGVPYVPLHRLREPAQTGFLRWLNSRGREPIAHKDARLGVAPEAEFSKFLMNAV